jgi:ATP-dependent Clp protease adaptor protein ClpS
VLVKVFPGMPIKRVTRIIWEAHTKGKAVTKRCHKELAKLYKESLQKEGLTASIEPDRQVVGDSRARERMQNPL